MRVIKFIFNDSMRLSPQLANTIGTSSYGNIIHKRQSLYDHACSVAVSAGIHELQHLKNHSDIETLLSQVSFDQPDTLYVILSANAAIKDKAGAVTLFQKLISAGMTSADETTSPALICCDGPEIFKRFLTLAARHETISVDRLNTEANILKASNIFSDISHLEEFNRYFSSDFDVRHFNSISGDFNTIVKSSPDMNKIKSEHDYYYLLPAEMQRWFVQPFNYSENNGTASYAMEKLNIANAGIQWVHNSFSLKQFGVFMQHCMHFIDERPKRPCSRENFTSLTQRLFLDKVAKRVDALKASSKFERIEGLLSTGTAYPTVDSVLEKYRSLFDAYIAKSEPIDSEVIGHGDLCFSNILYDKSSGVYKLIDPRGAQQEPDLWTHPYYDIAKLCHSVLGLYDFLNYELYEIVLNDNNALTLKIMAPNINPFREYFRSELISSGVDIYLCRLFEASLFLSMLPLHIDYPRKVLAFLLNGISILEELEDNA
jgi:hypothetical protein